MTSPSLVLVNPPFAAVHYPSIQLGLIQAHAEARGISTYTHYANVDLFNKIDKSLYNLISDHRGFQVGDWLFSYSAFGLDNQDKFFETYKEQIKSLSNDAEIDPQYLIELRSSVIPSFVSDCAHQIVKNNPRVVGFTSTFEQTVAGLAIAKAIKSIKSSTITVFGGANYDDEMGAAHFSNCEFVDVVLNGDFEPAADSLFHHLGLSRGIVPLHDSIRTRLTGVRAISHQRSVIESREYTSPIPEYRDYFTKVHGEGTDTSDFKSRIIIPFESSRGCWWGEKNHCTFCGLNGSGMKFRQRDASEVVQELATQNQRFGITNFAAVDNIIGQGFMNDIFSISEKWEMSFNIFYEVKANLKREQIRNFARSGIRSIQPGIESLSTPVLKLMKKGIRGIQNANTLKWSYYYGVQCSWNLLYGFPGEEPKFYREQLSNLRKIKHLPPPAGGGRIWLERFSPYYTGKASGFSETSYEPSLNFVYPEDFDKNAISYFFHGDGDHTISDSDYSETTSFLEDWREAWKSTEAPPYLYYMGIPNEIKIIDGRNNIREPIILRYKEPIGEIIRFTGEKPRSVESVCKHLYEKTGKKYREDNISGILDHLSRRDILIQEDNIYLSLAIPLSNHMRM